MNGWRLIPRTTKIALVLLGYLVVILAFLVLVRSSRLGVDIEDVRAWLRRDSTAPNGTLVDGGTPVPTPTYAPGAAWLQATVNAAVLSIPGANLPPLALLEAGQTAAIVGVSPDRQFWAVMLPYMDPTGAPGWVAAGQAIAQNAAAVPVLALPAAPGSTPIPLPTDQIAVLEIITSANVRRSPDLQAERLLVLDVGDILPVLGRSQDGRWYNIRLADGRTGWVVKDLVKVNNEANIPTPTAPGDGGTAAPVGEAQPGQASLSAAWTVNLRAGPGREYQVVGQLLQGQSAQIVGVSQDGLWWAIVFSSTENQRAWVAADYVQATNVDGVPVLK